MIFATLTNAIASITDIIQNPLFSNNYKTVKSALIGRFALSETIKLDKILDDAEIQGR